MKWVKASERLPEYDGRYIVCRFNQWRNIYEVCVDAYANGHWQAEIKDSSVTHWMELPGLPDEVKEEQKE